MNDELRDELVAALPPHQTWCHGEAHAECCGAGDCDCGITDALRDLLPVVRRYAAQQLRDAAADWPPTWAASPPDYMRDRADALEAGE